MAFAVVWVKAPSPSVRAVPERGNAEGKLAGMKVSYFCNRHNPGFAPMSADGR